MQEHGVTAWVYVGFVVEIGIRYLLLLDYIVIGELVVSGGQRPILPS